MCFRTAGRDLEPRAPAMAIYSHPTRSAAPTALVRGFGFSEDAVAPVRLTANKDLF